MITNKPLPSTLDHIDELKQQAEMHANNLKSPIHSGFKNETSNLLMMIAKILEHLLQFVNPILINTLGNLHHQLCDMIKKTQKGNDKDPLANFANGIDNLLTQLRQDAKSVLAETFTENKRPGR